MARRILLLTLPVVLVVLVFAVAATSAGRGEETIKELAPRTVTLNGDKVLLSAALEQVHRQTGIVVVSKRKEDPALKLDLTRVSFWQAMDVLAREAHARVSPYGNVALIEGSDPPPGSISYDGLFRTAVKKIVGVRDLDAGVHYYVVSLEVAWEPNFKPLLLESRPQAIVLHDDRGQDIKVPDNGSEWSAVSGKTTQEVDVRLPALARTVPHIGLLKGQMSVVGPTKMLSFTFAGVKEGVEQKQEGVTVKITSVKQREKVWTVQLALDYPPGGPRFESYQSWIVSNEISLKNAKGQIVSNSSYAVDSSTANRAVVSYHFADDPAKPPLLRGSTPDDWQLVYTTPARIVEVPIHFEFKDLTLP